MSLILRVMRLLNPLQMILIKRQAFKVTFDLLSVYLLVSDYKTVSLSIPTCPHVMAF